MRHALAVAAKAPRPGTVKTRLLSLLSAEEATELYRCFMKDTIESMESVSAAQVVVSYTPEGDESYFDGILSNGHPLLAQRGEGFGDKLFNALDDLLRDGFDTAAIMNADSPTLPRRYLAECFEELARPGDRVVLGPATDGGYYLIGIKQPHRRLFEDITWSTSSVLAETLDRAAELGLEVKLLPEWYDVDGVAEFERLKREIREGPEDREARADSRFQAGAHTRRFILSRWPRAAAGR
ncbi:MAG TPA: TIGR04282 family arsenosugar biosynthesis glycosyltransferase [Blastocatellia bacterium]|nr:TIGR04282 family arsenosugar biosynthesis glycosyltransferase [Blastocatellia bacterium]